MNTDVKEQSATRSVVTVAFDATEVSKKRQTLVKEFCKQIKMPGFRPGKVPLPLIEKRHAKDIAAELNRALINEAYKEGVLKTELEIFTIVDVEEGEFTDGEAGKVVFVVDVTPAFELPECKGIEIEADKAEVSDEEVEKALQMLLSERAEFKVAEKEATKGDYVKCSYEGKVGRKLIADLAPEQSILGTQKNTWEEVGNEDAPGVSSIVLGLEGMKAGDSKKIEHTFDKDHAVEELAGKKATYQVEVHEVREKILPELDEEFLKSVNAESEEKLRERIKDSLLGRKEQEIHAQKRQAVADFLLKSVDFEIPVSAFEQEKNSIMEDFARHNLRQGLEKEQMDAALTSSMEQIESTARERVKLDLIIGKVAEAEKIQVEQQDLSTLLYQQAMQSGVPIDKLVQELKKDQERLNSLRQSALFNKTIQFLVDQAKVTEKAA
ncbi:MAG: trigger factor [Puniceicoccaceae bacterium]